MLNPHRLYTEIELLKKYDKPGPRYTSYPTAPQFHDKFSCDDFQNELIRTNTKENKADVSLYFHLPFCKTLCLYCGCHTIITRKKDKLDDYLELLLKEIEMLSSFINPERKTTQIHWGGGTPNYMDPESILKLADKIKESFNIDFKTAEVSIEIDPRTLTKEHLPAIRKAGFNRASIGVQDLDERVQKAVNRIQPEAMIREVTDEIRSLGFDSLNFDLIYGLPYQTLDTFQSTLERVLAIAPDRFAVYNFAYVPWLKEHQKTLPTDKLPSPEEKLKMLKLIIERITSEGYIYIGMDHFAKPNDELALALESRTLHRNFQGYTTKSGTEVFSMGISSISQLYGAYAQNTKNMQEYKKMLDEGKLPVVRGIKLSQDDIIRRYVINQLMCNSYLDKSLFYNRFGYEFDDYFSNEILDLDEFVNDLLLVHNSDSIRITERGRLVLRNIAMVYDNYLPNDLKRTAQIYSRTV